VLTPKNLATSLAEKINSGIDIPYLTTIKNRKKLFFSRTIRFQTQQAHAKLFAFHDNIRPNFYGKLSLCADYREKWI